MWDSDDTPAANQRDLYVHSDFVSGDDWHATLGTDGSQDMLAVTATGSAVYVAGKSGHRVAPLGVRRSCLPSYLGCR